MNSILNYIDKYSTQVNIFLIGMIICVISMFIWLWLYNRKKYKLLKHQIPANVVQSYLDSIIQNSTSLKSSLFRGGGLDVDTSSVPSVMPLADLPGGSQVGISDVEVSTLNAKIASLESLLAEKKEVVKQLEDLNAENAGLLRNKDDLISELEARIAELEAREPEVVAQEADIDTSEYENKISDLEKEIEALKEQLKEYEVISGDIANMKRLQEENAQLRAALDGSTLSSENEESLATEEEVSDEEIEKAFEGAILSEEENSSDDNEQESVSEEKADTEEVEQNQEEEVAVAEQEQEDVQDEQEDKSAEDLLSEFEKMLG
ncbi:MAG: hypothetical protein N4A33_01385 [Bacteriovoracaceae bacterium]|nr:hypothetical protein [Bacteriovoracaceae bacterium]